MAGEQVARDTRSGPRSLIISPNLEALLEHDERTRRGTGGPWSAGSSNGNSPQSGSFHEGMPLGLPPPPRGPRQPRSPPSSKPSSPKSDGGHSFGCLITGTEVASPTSPSMTSATVNVLVQSPVATETSPNPYINPAPSLEEVLQLEQQEEREHRTASSMSPVGPAHRTSAVVNVLPRIREVGEGTPRLKPSGSGSGSVSRSPADSRRSHNQDSKQQQPRSLYPSLPRVDKLLGRGKSAFGCIADPDLHPGHPLVLPNDTRGPRPAKLTKQRGKHNMLQGYERPVMDIRREPTPDPNVAPTRGSPQPLFLSHGHNSSVSSMSLYSVDDQSSFHNHRISISSTIYPEDQSQYSPVSPRDRMSTLRNFVRNRTAPRDSVSTDSDRQSFIDLLSPDPHAISFRDDTNVRISRPSTPSGSNQFRSSSDDKQNVTRLTERPRSPKPPIPTTPKPIFNRPSTPLGISTRFSPKLSPAPSPLIDHGAKDTLPSTTNFLKPEERADFVRKSQKLSQVFGQPPGPAALNQHGVILSGSIGRLRHQRGAASISVEPHATSTTRQRAAWPPPEGTQYLTASGRRHSSPLSPDEFSFLSNKPITDEGHSSSSHHDSSSEHEIEVGTEEGVASSDWLNRKIQSRTSDRTRPDSPTSFIDLSDEEMVDDDGVSAIIATTPKKTGRRRAPSTQSLFENMTPEEQAEEERRRKREKLVKLHRFLGSRVPTNLALGLEEIEIPLPPAAECEQSMAPAQEESKKMWLRRRRSSSAVAVPSTWSDDVDRLKEELNEREKAINVRRAQKMERVFGVAPPQTLYHTRHSPSPSLPSSSASTSLSTNSQPTSPGLRNVNQTAYMKPHPKRSDRPGTSESSKFLLPNKGAISIDDDPAPPQQISYVYTHYQHSLNSLNDIIDRDDKESLAELHEYLQNGEITPSPTLQDFTRGSDRRLSSVSTKSERRRSLPARTSMLSIASEYSITTPKPEVTDFQLRRRRAAKLTQFFGVNYRELIKDVLESIEKGLEDERKRGTLNPEEVEDLLQKLRTLRTKRGQMY